MLPRHRRRSGCLATGPVLVERVALTDTQQPAGRRLVEEERRNCFVAITRVRESLTLTRSTTYFGWPKEPSQFITEMGLAP